MTLMILRAEIRAQAGRKRTFYAQGIFVDSTTPEEPLRLTSQAAEIHIGP